MYKLARVIAYVSVYSKRWKTILITMMGTFAAFMGTFYTLNHNELLAAIWALILVELMNKE